MCLDVGEGCRLGGQCCVELGAGAEGSGQLPRPWLQSRADDWQLRGVLGPAVTSVWTHDRGQAHTLGIPAWLVPLLPGSARPSRRLRMAGRLSRPRPGHRALP